MKLSGAPLSSLPIAGTGGVQAQATEWESAGGALGGGSARFRILSNWTAQGGAVAAGTNNAPALTNWQTSGGGMAGGTNRLDSYRDGKRIYEAIRQAGFFDGWPRGSARPIRNTGIIKTGVFNGAP